MTIDVSDNTFQTEVLDRSQTTPVVVDLWAPWCGPCHQLSPIIEKVIDETEGKVVLAKVNVDDNPQVSAAFRVQGIPAVFAISGGKVVDGFIGAQGEAAVREAAETVAIILSLVAPFTAEEMWERLGHQPSVARAGWPTADPALLVEDSVTCVVQVQGKVRAKLDVAPSIAADALEQLALADANVQRAIGDGTVRKVIVKPPKVVNVVVG